MRFLNLIANKLVLAPLHLAAVAALHRHAVRHQGAAPHRTTSGSRPGRTYFGDFDPFGDFDLIFGASKLSLKAVEIPIRYASRTYGETQISRFRHGLMLLRMVVFAFLRIKAL